jgi:hypothetical protein
MRVVMFLFLLVSGCDDDARGTEPPDLAVQPVGGYCSDFFGLKCATGLKCCVKACPDAGCPVDGNSYCEPNPPPPGFLDCQ